MKIHLFKVDFSIWALPKAVALSVTIFLFIPHKRESNKTTIANAGLLANYFLKFDIM